MSYRQRNGQQSAPERPDRVRPVPDTHEHDSMPYRGVQTHGVKPTSKPRGPEDHYTWDDVEDVSPEDAEEIEYVEPEDEPEPVPVRVVQGSARERLDFRALRVPVTDIGARIVGRHDRRRNIRIKVDTGVSDIYIGPDSGVSTYTGYKLYAGESVDIRSTEEIWGICASGDASEISIMYEYGVEL